MAVNLTNRVIKQYWKTKNAEKVRQKWAEESDTPPPTRLTIYRLHNKFDQTGSICNAPKNGRPISVTTHENEVGFSGTYLKPKKIKKEGFY
jgi:hypothetical protein